MKTIWVILITFFISMLAFDISTIYIVRENVSTANEKALEDALLVGTQENDLQRGEIILDSVKAEEGYIESVERNLKLDNTDSKGVIFNIRPHLQVYQYQQDDEEKIRHPYLEGKIEAEVATLSTKLIGMEGYPIKVKRIQFSLTKFK